MLGIVFQISVVSTHVIFNNIYMTGFVSAGILLLGFTGYITYNRDQERKMAEKVNTKFRSLAEEVAMIKVGPGRKRE